MNFRNIGVVISREYMTRVKKKSFLLITFLGPILFAAMMVLPSLIMFFVTDKGKQIAVIDESGIVMPQLKSDDSYIFTDYSGHHPDSVKADLKELGVDVLMIVSPVIDSTKTVNVTTYSTKALSVELKSAIESQVDDAVEDYRISLYDIGDLKQIMAEVKADVSVTTYTIDDSGEAKLDSAEVKMIVSMLLGMIIYMFIAMFSAMVMSSVIEEKSSRVVEVLVSSVKATELMFGKIVGVAAVALTQFLLWIVLTGVIVYAVGGIIGFDSIMGSSQQMSAMAGVDQSALDATGMNLDPSAMAAGLDTQGNSVLSALRDLNYTEILVSFVIFFVLGYLLYASLFAAIGSSVENEADSSQLQIPVTIPLLLGFFIALYAFKSPDSPLAFWGSIIPFTSPIVMLARIPFGVPMWEIVLSIALLLLTFLGCAWLSAKIYKIGILTFGKKSTFKDLWKWLRMK